MTLDAKDEYTRGHSHRVSEYAALIASELDWKKEDIRHLKLSTHLHDIGKIGIPDSILNKPTRLTPEEYNVIKEHTVIGAEILKNITLIDHLVEISRSHHERYDGNGYPDGLKGDAIPIQARIVAIADSYDAMCSRRIYRNALSPEEIYAELKKNKGTQFDPKLTDIFLKLLDENRVVIEGNCEEDGDDSNLPHIEIEKFISDVMITIKAQEDSESYDFLTGLPMRTRGEKLVAQFMQEFNGCLIFMDMDNLKKINDIYGHKAGDRALRTLGHLLSETAKGSVVCRLGGDEFLLFLPDVSKETVSETVKQLLEKFQSIKSSDPELQYASLSAGLCMTEKGDSFEECYTKADKALYYVKQNGKGNFFFYQQMETEVLTDSATGKDLTLIM